MALFEHLGADDMRKKLIVCLDVEEADLNKGGADAQKEDTTENLPVFQNCRSVIVNARTGAGMDEFKTLL